MTINFYLDSKRNKKDQSTVYCVIRGREIVKPIYLNTGFKIEVNNWNSTSQKVRRSNSSFEINSYFDKLKDRIQSLFAQHQKQGFDLAAFKADVKALLNPISISTSKAHNIIQVLELFIKIRENELAKNTTKKYRVLKNHLKRYQSNKNIDLMFESIDLNFFDDFLSFQFRELKFTNNTVHKTMGLLKTFMRWAEERNYHSNQTYHKFRTKPTETEIVYLTEAELLKLFNMDLSEQKRLSRVRDLFCYACFTGQRYSDILNLNLDDIKNGVWNLRTIKTRDIIEVPLNNFAREIVKKYKARGVPFPKISNQKMNNYVKELCKIADLNTIETIIRYRGSKRIEISRPKHDLITTHTARRTFVTLSLEKGMRTEVVMSITGHKDYKTFKKYLKITNTVKRNEMLNVWNK